MLKYRKKNIDLTKVMTFLFSFVGAKFKQMYLFFFPKYALIDLNSIFNMSFD